MTCPLGNPNQLFMALPIIPMREGSQAVHLVVSGRDHT
jgi:hypothetical protein